jgi:RNA polymerase primary sigma factor
LDRVSSDDEAALAETVPDLAAPSPFDVASNRLLRERLMDLLTELPERERLVVGLRYGLIDRQACTSAEVARRIHLTRERVRQREMAALAKLRHGPGAVDLVDFIAPGHTHV